MSLSRTKKARVVGVALVAFALLMNRWFVAYVFCTDNRIDSVYSVIGIYFFQAACASLGLLLIWKAKAIGRQAPGALTIPLRWDTVISCTCGFVLVVFVAFAYGTAVGELHVFPHHLVREAWDSVETLRRRASRPWYYKRVEHQDRSEFSNSRQVYKGLNLVTRVASDRQLVAEIIDMDGTALHRWHIDWFKIWPDAQHLPKYRIPRARPGTHIHGAVVMEDGELVFNFDHLGLVCLDRDGQVVWRLPYQTHHSIHRHDGGNLWVCGQKEHTEPNPRFPNRVPPFAEYMILEVTPDGSIAEEWSVAELLRENGYGGLLHLGSLNNRSTRIEGDSLHLNDVEPLPTSMKQGFFKRGDVLVSLRNINTVFVFNRQTREIKFICTGWFVRQHDPDFIDGNRFSVFDNNNIAPEEHGHQSRIVIVSARDSTMEVFFEGNSRTPFYTDIMGKHQWLPNGNLLITESVQGRAFETTPQGEVVWEYMNYVEPGVVGLVEEVQRLPAKYRKVFAGR